MDGLATPAGRRLSTSPPKRRAPVRLTPAEIAAVRAMVIAEDASILALDKPPGLSSQGGRGQVNTLDELLWAFAKSNGDRPRLVHRLDRDTSGVILTAKTRAAAAFLGKAMMARRFVKTYVALVSRAPEPREGTIEAPLRREEIGREAFMRVCDPDHPDAERPPSTRYRAVAAGQGLAPCWSSSPRTGRMHQLRVHLAHLGRPDPRRRALWRRAHGATAGLRSRG